LPRVQRKGKFPAGGMVISLPLFVSACSDLLQNPDR